jgi:hypothetical protein
VIDSHIPPATLRKYLDGLLPPREIFALHEHCDSCDSCRRLLSESAGSRVEAATHPTEQECVVYAAGGDVEDWVNLHMRSCSECRATVADLETIEPRRSALPGWIALAAAVLLTIGAAGYWYRMRPQAPQELALLRDDRGPITWNTALPEAELVRQAMRTGKLPAGERLWAEQGDLLRGREGNQVLKVIAPVAVRIISDQPEFRWSGCSGGRYQVQVFDEDLNPLISSGELDGTSWQTNRRLDRGKRYLWQVQARCGGRTLNAPAPPDPAARFEVAGEAVLKRIDAAKESHLAKAVIYASESLPDSARAEIGELEKLNPGSVLVESLRRSMDR